MLYKSYTIILRIDMAQSQEPCINQGLACIIQLLPFIAAFHGLSQPDTRYLPQALNHSQRDGRYGGTHD